MRHHKREILEGLDRIVAFLEKDEDRYALMKDAILSQSNYMKDAIQGYGIDLHILGLRESAKELDIPVPSLFTDDGYKTFNYFKLSTSQVATRNMIGVCYGAVVPDIFKIQINSPKWCICPLNIEKASFIYLILPIIKTVALSNLI
ncbi:hypothetical protein LOTGIDRAFT_154499 [Lottia gigantea]|uniref:Choline/carnitine acyltransferase domain-containing protein n=1 Tax=Lottia gigantea TaxID=225164 RepID=V3Z842_LOTGI|nr:hypothetical protein LOTGIDRAFT_154499 [Lottia gigantea]ESO87018.1 hypothetical protein LOTGIDRAFT_154499 [Lottia gigantea]